MRIRRVAGLVLVVTGLSCSGDGSEPTGPGGDGGERVTGAGYDITYTSSTIALTESQAEEAMIAADPETHVYQFDADRLASDGTELVEGRILLIPGVALRRIESVTTAAGVTTVSTSYATLNEAIEDGTISWDEPMRFTPDVIGSAQLNVDGEWSAPTAASGASVQWQYEVGANTVKAQLEAAGSSATLIIEVTHKVGGAATARFTATTTFQEMASRAQVEIEDHETRSFDFESAGLGGTMELEMAAAGAGLDDLAFEWPEAMMRFPITIGPVPAMLIVKAQVVTKLVVQGQASATATTSFTWGGDAGFEYNGTAVSTKASANLGLPNVGSSATDAAAGIGNPVDAQFGIAAPRIEVALFGETIVPWIRPEFFVGSRLTWGPVCKSAYVRYLVTGGIDLRFLGTTLATKEDTIAGPHEVRESQNDCAEGAAASAPLSMPAERWVRVPR